MQTNGLQCVRCSRCRLWWLYCLAVVPVDRGGPAAGSFVNVIVPEKLLSPFSDSGHADLRRRGRSLSAEVAES